MVDIQLIAMPYAAVERPSLALGVLKASLVEHGLSASVLYANLDFAEALGLKNYFFFSNSLQMAHLGEWTFSGAAFPDFSPDHEKYLHTFKDIFTENGQFLWNVRNKTEAFIDRTARRVLAAGPLIVGCSSMFQQQCASLAVLRRIKSLQPEVITLLGGANCEASMGAVTHQASPWVDFVVSGEADQLLPGLCKSILDHGREIPAAILPEGVYGPAHRADQNRMAPPTRAMVSDLNATPVPDFDDYFDALDASPIAPSIKPGLPIETSRGCWWGEKEQCVFCGVNGSRITHRAKSPDRIVNEMMLLRKRHGIGKFVAADSMLGMEYFRTVLPRLAQKEHKYYPK